MLYNDGFAAVLGARHPAALGRKLREAWPEAGDAGTTILREGLAGRAHSVRGLELTLHRHGRPEPAALDLDGPPVPGDDGRPAGVLLVLTETAASVRAHRAAEDEARRHADRAQHLLTSFIEAVPGVVYAKDRDGRILLANRSFAEQVGRTQEDT